MVDFPAMMTEIRSFLGKYDLLDHTLVAVQICCEELANNILTYAYGAYDSLRYVDIDLRKLPDRLMLSIRDDGKVFDPTVCEESSGLELRLVRGFSASVQYTRLAGQNFVTVTCNL